MTSRPSGRCAATEALEWIAYAADRGLRLGSEHGALLYTSTAARAVLASPCCVSAADQEQVKEALVHARALARAARSQGAAPSYDEEAIRDALWAVVDALLGGNEEEER